ncbi:MAG: PAS domain S-box protein [Hydrogenophilales bacterium]|nr:PAS domain S-box protein [Hydrogenophilales bacterium]
MADTGIGQGYKRSLRALITFVVSRVLHLLRGRTNPAPRFELRGFSPCGARDLAECTHIERTLRDSEEKFRALVETTQDLFWEVDAEIRYTYLSPRIFEILGYRPEEILGKRPSDLMPPEEAERVTALIQEITAQRASFTLLENVRLHKDGRRVILETCGIPIFDAQGNYAGYRGVGRDITKRIQAEQMSLQLGRILDDALEEIYIFDVETLRFLRVNRGARVNLGYTQAELESLTPLDIKPLYTRESFEALLAPLRRGDTEHIQFKTIHRRKDGSSYPVEVRLQLSQAATGPVFFAFIQDITTRQAAERALVLSRDALRDFSAHLQQAREEEKSKIAREIHDELGGTLSALKMDAFWLLSKLPAGQEALQQKAQAMLVLIDTAVRATRRIVTELRPTILDDLGLVAAMQWQAREFELRTGIACNLHFPPDEPALDEARATVLFRILQEALTNIAKHARAGDVDVRYEAGGEAVTLIIQDDGCGISLETMNNPASHGIRGMQERAHYLNGVVRVEPRSNEGTIVSVRLPRAPSSGTLNA